MKYYSILIGLLFSLHSIAQLPEIRFTNIKECVYVDTTMIVYHTKNVSEVKWSTTGSGYFFDSISSGTDTINYYVFAPRDKMDSPFVVRATAENSLGKAVDEGPLKILGMPDPKIPGDSNCLVHENVKFNAVTHPRNETVKMHFWDFGDGDTVSTTDTIVYHQFNKPGTFLVKLCATNTHGCRNCIKKRVFVNWPNSIDELNAQNNFTIHSSDGVLLIQSISAAPFSYQIISMSGQIVSSGNALGQVARHDNFEGMYIIHLQDNAGSYQIKYLRFSN